MRTLRCLPFALFFASFGCLAAEPASAPDSDEGDPRLANIGPAFGCDLSASPSVAECCDSPWNHSSSLDPDDYPCAAQCSHYFEDYPVASPPFYDHRSELLCEAVIDRFDELATIAPGVQPCGVGFGTVDGCYNRELPPPPSIRRSLYRAYDTRTYPTNAVSTETTKPWGPERSSPGQFVAVANHRSSTDGRLVTAGGATLAMFYPENVDYGLRASTDVDRPILDRATLLPPWMRVSPAPGASRYPRGMLERNDDVRAFNFDLCSTNGPDSTDNPRSCQAQWDGGTPISGDCYAQTLLFSNRAVDAAANLRRWEIRTLDVVVFVPEGKAAMDATVAYPDQGIWVYPASAVNDPTALPDAKPYSYGSAVVQYDPGGPTDNTKWIDTDTLVARYDVDCTGPSPAPWCAFIHDQRSIAPTQDYEMEGFGSWDGTTFAQSLLEPTTTADGMVLVVHNHDGIAYSYNDVGPCDASGWREFKHLSSAHLDPEVSGSYGFATYPVRDTQGNVIPPGTTVRGAYPWIDRRGDNLFFPAAATQDGYRVYWNEDATWTDSSGTVQTRSRHSPTAFDEQNAANARGLVVVGAWTRGKEVLIDGGVNYTDWKTPLFAVRGSSWYVQLYQGATTAFRNDGIRLMSSWENQFNHYDAMAPISPFDVVWMLGTSGNHTTELVFDEYLHRDALVVAHMNAPLGAADQPPDVAHFDLNGFASMTGDDRNFAFVGDARLQNAATVDDPAELRLRGGAFIPPVAEGGVRGKGIWLDGVNDHIEISGLPAGEAAYYLGLWLDMRGSDQFYRTVFSFGPGAYVAMGPAGLVVDNGVEDQALALGGITEGRYVHLGLAVYPDGLEVFIDGTHEATVGLGMPALPSTLHVGKPASHWSWYSNVQAWVDELRVYRLDPATRLADHELELACNHALGSMANGQCDQIDVWADRATGADGLDSSLDFPAAAYEQLRCGTSVHRNAGPDCQRAMLNGVHGRHLVADQSRPPFSGVPFCVSCHDDIADPVPGLRPSALVGGLVDVRVDPRRQPMVWPRRLFGALPSVAGQEVLPGAGVTGTDAWLDDYLLGSSAVEAPTRITP